uniref:P-type domain-containing protein n=1 Tax=Leptobrachium leishanense TaxID=445787 RepID=A0A8C5LY21_9ANUR
MSNMYWLLAAVFILGAERAGSETQGFCDFDASSRVNCGNERTSYDTCKSNGCCYDSSKMGYIWCFQPWSVKALHFRNTEVLAAMECNLYRICNYNNPSARANCGMEGINEQKCTKENDCCYDEKTSGVPSCFPKDLIAVTVTCNVATSEKVNCGMDGISKDTCRNKDCCYYETPTGPWCYKMKITG